jgi:cytochrome c biogenesis protein CcmG, thiol:disulfide interchange protein DsbE
MNDHRHTGADPYADLTRRTHDRKRLGLWVGGVVIGIVAVLALLAILLSGGGSDGPAASGTGAAAAADARQETATVRVSGEDLVPYPSDAGTFLLDPARDPAAGALAPTLQGESFDGSPITIGGPGGPRMVVFLAHWCPHCQAEVPVLQEWLDEGRAPEGFTVQSVSTAVAADRPNHPPSAWLAREGWEPQVLVDDPDGTAATAYGLSSFPYFVLLDADGRVVQRGSGEVPTAEIDAAVARLMAGAPTT